MNYDSAHEKVRRLRGRARQHTCPCGAPAQDWAYQGSEEEQVSPEGLRYSENPSDYLAMCKSCHLRLDRHRTHCPKGHELVGENLLIEEGRRRRCRTCRREKHRNGARRRRTDPEWHARELEYRRQWWATNRNEGKAS